MLPRNFQSRYRGHLFDLKLLFQITRARRSLNQLSRFRIHLVQEFKIGPIQTRKNVLETNIVVLHDHTPQISLPDPPFLRSRRNSRHRSLSLFLARAVGWYIFDESFILKTNILFSHVIGEKKDV